MDLDFLVCIQTENETKLFAKCEKKISIDMMMMMINHHEIKMK